MNAREDLELVPAMWLTKYPSSSWHKEFKTCVYQRHNSNERSFVFNRGFEAGIYLRYIVDHYDSLPDIVAFVQEDATSDIGDRLACLRTNKDWGWTPLNMFFVEDRDLSIWRSRGVADAVHACWYNLAADFGIVLPTADDPVVSFYCCAYFAITRKQIRLHSRKSYASAYQRVVNLELCSTDEMWNGRSVPPNAGDKDTSAGAFEHLQHSILGGQPLRMTPFTNSDWCFRFLPSDVCPGSPCI